MVHYCTDVLIIDIAQCPVEILDSLVYTDDYGNVVIADDVTTDDTRVLIPNNTVSTTLNCFLNLSTKIKKW